MNDETRPAPPRSPDAGVQPISQADVTVDTYRVVDPDGSHDPDRLPGLEPSALRDLYRWLVLQRTFDERATRLQRRGRLGTYASGRGQEAAIIGSAFALDADDWLFPYGREAGALLMHGLSMRDLLLYWRGVEDASRMVGGNIFGLAISIGSHIPVVAGMGWGMRLDGADRVAFANLGDGATSTGAFHEGLNLAGVLGAPCVFFCQNNQYAISLPFEEQTAADTVAQKALAYGVDGIRVDGNDVLAVYNAVAEARRRARDGTPVLVEAVTYRQAAHTTSDDPTRYRPESEVEEWRERDPLDRYRAFLAERGLLDEVDEAAIEAEVDAQFSDAVEAADAYETRGVEAMFEYVHAEMPPALRRQLAAFERFLEEHPETYDYIEQRPKG
jgi:pyruvate dehydrogenase E1 component alpha subunit